MKKGNRKSFCIAMCMLAAFLLWTIAIRIIDVQPIGPQGSAVGFATINRFVHDLTGVHMSLYTITDWLSLVPFGFVMGFALLGFVQWVERKAFLKVDRSILALGGFYIVVMVAYAIFEVFVINYRPVLIDGYLEASYPSSTTMLVMCVMPTAVIQCRARIKNDVLKRCAASAMIAFVVFMVIGRLISGVHWFTDIIGGALLSAGLVMLYHSVSELGKGVITMKYAKSAKYQTPDLLKKIMGPNPVKLEEELLLDHNIQEGAVVCDLGSGQGLTSVFLAKEYGFKVYAADLWSDPCENARFFEEMGLSEEQIVPVKADATDLPFEKNFFDAVISTDSYNYFGRDPGYLDDKLLPFIKSGGYIYIAVPGMKKDCHDNLPQELLLSWTPEQLDYIHDIDYWASIMSRCKNADVVSVKEMESNQEVWQDWLMQENEYAVGDRKAMAAGGGKYLNFIAIVLRKK